MTHAAEALQLIKGYHTDLPDRIVKRNEIKRYWNPSREGGLELLPKRLTKLSLSPSLHLSLFPLLVFFLLPTHSKSTGDGLWLALH